jgi:hypothetical protein
LLSTYYENVGDDLIRLGAQQQIGSALQRSPRWDHVTKSNALSLDLPLSRATHAPLGRMSADERRDAAAAASALRGAGPVLADKIAGADAFVVAGTPLFYFVGDESFLEIEAAHGCDWPRVVFADRIESRTIPRMIALGVGSIYEGPAEAIVAAHPRAAEFIRRFVDRAALVTTRDAPTDALVRAACPGGAARILRSVCPSFWAAERFGAGVPVPQRRVTICFALESADWDRSAPHEVVVEARENALSRVITYFRKRNYALALVAHNRSDVDAAATVAQRRGLPPPELIDAERLIDEVSRSEVVVTWRVHGAIAARSVGRPALLFRTDSRWETAAEFGVDVVDDRAASKADLEAALDRLCEAAAQDPAETMAAAGAMRAREFARLRDPLVEALGRQASRGRSRPP